MTWRPLWMKLGCGYQINKVNFQAYAYFRG